MKMFRKILVILVWVGALAVVLLINSKISSYGLTNLPADAENLEELKIKEVKQDRFAFKSLSGDLIEIGEKRHSPSQPYLKLNRWGGEVSLKVDIPYGKNGEKSLTQNRLRWANHKYDIDFYPREPEEIEENGRKFTINEEGGVEFDVILKEKPESNVFEFPIETKGLKFYEQPELTQEEKEKGAFRPENVVGSYAVYHQTQDKFFKTNEEAEKYKTGKAFHIYRPKITDANGNWTWGELNITNNNETIEQFNNLTITIPQDWLDNAIYPVRIDPNFGYETRGGSWGESGAGANILFGSLFTSPADAGTATSMTFAGSRDNSFGDNSSNAKCVIVLHSNLSIITNGITSPVTGINYDTTAPWRTAIFTTSPTLSSNTEYVLMIISDYAFALRYDAGTTNQGHRDPTNSYATPINPTDATHYDRKYSIYCTYTAAPVVVDIGLRVYDGTSIVSIACEPAGTLTSSLRIRKGSTTYGIGLVDPADPNASKIRIQTSSGVKALRKYP